MKKYDFIVVGAGNAGLSACLKLASEGKKTLLIEQHNVPGGCASSFVRGRFEFDPSLHELCDYGPENDPGDVRQIMKRYSVNLDMVKVDDCFRVISKYSDGSDMDVSMPSGVDNFVSKIGEIVPGSYSSVKKLFQLFEEVRDGIQYITDSKGHADSAVLKSKYPNMLRTGAYSTKKVFDALNIPQKAQDILSTYWSYLGVDMEHLAFIHYAAMVYKYVSRSAYIPRHTSHQMSLAMEERFRELGGEVWYGCRAEKFLFENDVCCGVLTNYGEVKADYVLANINTDIIYSKMIPSSIVPERDKKLSAARNRNFSARMFTIYLGLNKTAEELGIKDYSIFLQGTADSAKEKQNIMKGLDSNDYSIFLCYNVVNPSFSPKGTSVVSFTTINAPDDWNKLEDKDYFAKKESFAYKILNSFKKNTGIDLLPHIEEIATASPLTFARFLNVPEGSVYGHETADWDGMMARMMSIQKDYKIKHFRPIGTDGPRGDGYSAAYICGELMANYALKDLENER